MIARYAVNLNINAKKLFNKVTNKVAKVVDFGAYAPVAMAA